MSKYSERPPHRLNVPSLKRPIAETVHRRNGRRQNVYCRNGIAKTASPKRHRPHYFAELSSRYFIFEGSETNNNPRVHRGEIMLLFPG